MMIKINEDFYKRRGLIPDQTIAINVFRQTGGIYRACVLNLLREDESRFITQLNGGVPVRDRELFSQVVSEAVIKYRPEGIQGLKLPEENPKMLEEQVEIVRHLRELEVIPRYTPTPSIEGGKQRRK